jgi:hypothetical protein
MISVAGIGREASGSHTEAHSDGLILKNIDALSADGEYIVAGHAMETNSIVTQDVPEGLAERWERVWYLTKTGSDGSGTLTLGFDYEKGIAGLPILDPSDYRLLRRSGPTGDFSLVNTIGASILDGSVFFDLAETEISDGYYTIGSISSDPLATLNDGPGGVGRSDGLSKLKLWLKADVGVSGSSVSEWTDQSGSGNNAAQASSGSQPLLQTDVLNGKPVIRFDGTNDYLQTAVIPSFNTDVFTWFMVLQSTSTTQIYMRSRYETNAIQWGSYTQNSLFQSHARDIAGAFKGSQNAWNPSFNIISAIWNSGDSVTQYLNGVDSVTAMGADVVPGGHEFTRIGANSSGTPDGFMDGDMAEIIVFTTDLNTTQRILIENHLSAKYGIALTTNVKYSGHDPAYTMSVAGIGREGAGDMHTEAHSDGLILRDVNALSQDGEYIVTGHSSSSNSLVTQDLPEGIVERWQRVWYLARPNSDNVGGLLLVFDYVQGGQAGPPDLGASEYRLLYRSGTSGDFAVVSTAGIAVSENQVGFDLSESDLLDGYYTIGSSSNDPLPVQISAFTARANRLNAELQWRTETETGNHGFELERRTVSSSKFQVPGPETFNLKPETAWTTIGFVPGSGTSSSPRDYSFVDKPDEPGRYAYRIKQIDHSGAFTYTSTLELEIGLAPLEFTLSQNYPNPFNPTTTIEFTLPEDGRVKLRIYNMLGEEIVTLVDEERKAGVYQQILFDASRLATGLYISRLEFKGSQVIKKMLLVK